MTWLHLLALALVSALSPAALIPAIFLLSRAGPRAVLAFALGSVCSVAVLAGIVAAGVGVSGSGRSHGTTEARAVFEIVVGLLCLVFAYRIWNGREAAARRAAETEQTPSRWLGYADRLGVAGAYVFGLFWINGVFAIDAGLVIAQAGYSSARATVAVLAYAVAAAGGALSVYVVYRASPEQSEVRLARLRAWMQTHSRAALAVLLYAAALLFVVKGAAGVLS